MKLSSTVPLLLAVSLEAVTSETARPQLSLTLKEGSSLSSALAPNLFYSGSKDGIDFGCNIDLTTQTKSIWGQTTNAVGDFDVKTKLEYTDHGKYSYPSGAGAYLTVQGDNGNTYAWFSAAASTSGVEPLKVGGKKIFGQGDAKIMIEPRHSFEKECTDVCLGYEKDDTRVYLTASADDQNVKVIQHVNADNCVSAKYGRKAGFMYATWANENKFGSTKVTLKSDNVNVDLSKDGWKASISTSAPYSLDSEPSVSFSKKFTI